MPFECQRCGIKFYKKTPRKSSRHCILWVELKVGKSFFCWLRFVVFANQPWHQGWNGE